MQIQLTKKLHLTVKKSKILSDYKLYLCISSQSNINFTCIELSENKPQLVPKLNWEKESQKGNLPYHYFLVISSNGNKPAVTRKTSK